MTVIEKINEINEALKEIFDFTQTNETIKSDFTEYLSTIGARNISLNQMEKIFLPYVFERRIAGKSILDMYKEEKGANSIIDKLNEAQASIFEIKKILKNGFELYNLVNEKTYKVLSLTRMTNFRGVYAGQFIVGRIFELDGEYYIIEISSVLSHSQKEEAYRYAVMKLVQTPRLLYLDNSEKEAEIKAKEMINSGEALDKLKQMVKSQGGDISYIEDENKFGFDKYKAEIKAEKQGYISKIDAQKIGNVCVILGAGRNVKTDNIDPLAGILFKCQKGDYINKNDTVMTLYSNDEKKLKNATALILNSFEISDIKPNDSNIILKQF